MYAIAATLLILDVQASGSPLGHELLRIWPSYVAYAVSFLIIGEIWINQHTMFAQIDHVDRAFLMINIVFLMAVAFLPFPTRIVADHGVDKGAKAAALTYGITISITAVVGRRSVVLRFEPPSPPEGRRRPPHRGRYLPHLGGGPLTYPVATLVALASPNASLLLYAAITVFYLFESSLLARSRDG